MSDYDKRLFAYQMAMALARSMRSKGLISAKEYAKIDTIIANKYGISSCSISLWKSGRQCRQKLNGELSSTNRSRPHSRLSFTLVAFSVQNAGRTSAGKQRQHGWFGSVPRSTPKEKNTALPSRYRRPPLTSWCDRSRMTLSASKKSLPMTATPCTFTFQTALRSHAPGQTVHELKAGRRK